MPRHPETGPPQSPGTPKRDPEMRPPPKARDPKMGPPQCPGTLKQDLETGPPKLRDPMMGPPKPRPFPPPLATPIRLRPRPFFSPVGAGPERRPRNPPKTLLSPPGPPCAPHQDPPDPPQDPPAPPQDPPRPPVAMETLRRCFLDGPPGGGPVSYSRHRDPPRGGEEEEEEEEEEGAEPTVRLPRPRRRPRPRARPWLHPLATLGLGSATAFLLGLLVAGIGHTPCRGGAVGAGPLPGGSTPDGVWGGASAEAPPPWPRLRELLRRHLQEERVEAWEERVEAWEERVEAWV
ncbi:proline-rich protein HaeIII subfamily 1-like, partial [Vidua macroura]|uniref:proline-rich protein HaeIII subfamily 1-like n=1 Tax=Vidua macroura TaxID=187451 RepID=UPI0023A7B658